MVANQERMMTYLGKTENTALEANSEELEILAEHRKVPKENAAVKPVGGLRKRHRSRHLALGCRGQPEERTRGNGGSRKKLAATDRRMARRAGVARLKGHVVRKNRTRDKGVRGARKGRTLGRR
jgi:hypothetical protein